VPKQRHCNICKRKNWSTKQFQRRCDFWHETLKNVILYQWINCLSNVILLNCRWHVVEPSLLILAEEGSALIETSLTWIDFFISFTLSLSALLNLHFSSDFQLGDRAQNLGSRSIFYRVARVILCTQLYYICSFQFQVGSLGHVGCYNGSRCRKSWKVLF